jgi:hypothetical protein
MSQKKSSRVVLSIEQKSKLHEMIKNGVNKEQLKAKFKIADRTLYREIQNATTTNNRSHQESKMNINRKRYQKPKYYEIEDKVYEIHESIRQFGLPVSGPYLRLLADRTAKQLLEDPNCPEKVKSKYNSAIFGNSWLLAFKNRWNIKKLRLNGERASVPLNVDELMKPIIEVIKDLNIPISNIYNWDETGLFYRSMPRYTLASGLDDGAGAKEDKVRITALLSVSGDGSKKKLVVIGKSKVPRGTSEEFWKENGIQYFYNSKAWMNSTIWNKLLKEFDDSLDAPSILIVDNFSGHDIDPLEDYKYLIPIFLPPNTTSVTQALDAGIISLFKVKYRSKLVNFVCERIEENRGSFKLNEITIAKIIPWVKESFMEVEASTIRKCFYKTLKLEMFSDESKEYEESIQQELADPLPKALSTLTEIVELYLGTRVNPMELVEYALHDPHIDIQEDFEEESDDDIIVENPSTMMAYNNSLLRYFTNTGCPMEVYHCLELKKKLQKHLNFE